MPHPPSPPSLTSSGRPAPSLAYRGPSRNDSTATPTARAGLHPPPWPSRAPSAGRSRDIRYIVGIPFASRDPRRPRHCTPPLPRPARRIPAGGGASRAGSAAQDCGSSGESGGGGQAAPSQRAALRSPRGALAEVYWQLVALFPLTKHPPRWGLGRGLWLRW